MLVLLLAAALAGCLVFLTYGARGNWSFILTFRGTKLLALALVAYAVAVSTVIFQTITNNRILTPSIMGFDSLFGFLQTLLVFLLGANVVAGIDARLMFVVEVAVMVGFSLLLFRFMFADRLRSLHLLLLVGIFFGILFRSASGFLQRIIDPNDFVVLQDRLFASFNTIDPTLLGISLVLILAASLFAFPLLHRLDVMALGREAAISLGVDHRRTSILMLSLCVVLVSVSTALVGPVTFFGLLVANLAYLLMPVATHRHVLPAAVLIAFTALVFGQTILERALGYNTALAIVIEFAGGLFFILYLIKGRAR
ncbi:MAG: iron chelate uptake ABC transporter family permease subunit [Rhizobium sp.]|nr:iron chelate uptake ABC transporter family permease subunit [Rhizobium sp.]